MRVKICGISTHQDLTTAAEAGATYVGLVFYPPSPRALTVTMAGELARNKPPGVATVGLFVDPDDAMLDAIVRDVPLDFVQLHGQESPERVIAVRQQTRLPIIKAVRIRGADDLAMLDTAEAVADQVLCDGGSDGSGATARPGGNGVRFDWQLLAGRQWQKPWLLAGGLTPENVATAIESTGATQVDVSSGVEDAPGHKAPQRIVAFLRAAGVTPRTPTHM